MLLTILIGCSKAKSFDIQNAKKIEFHYGNTGNTVEIIDIESIEQITDNINAVTYKKEKPSKGCIGWSYLLRWYDSYDNLIDEIIISESKKVDYNGHFYTVSDGDIDTEFLDVLMK